MVTLFLGKVLDLFQGKKIHSLGALGVKLQLCMVVTGLRGPVALALVTQMPTSSGEQFLEAVYFVIFWSNVVLGGLTKPLVQFLGIKNEVDGTMDLSEFQFTEEEAEYLGSIETMFARLEKLLLTHTGQKNSFSNSARGRHASLWEAKVQEAITRGRVMIDDRISQAPKVKRARRDLDRALADKMPGKSEAARTMIITDLENALRREQRIAARSILDTKVWDPSDGVSETSLRAERLDSDNPVFEGEGRDGATDADDDGTTHASTTNT